ncbi:P-loop NTPase family protein [Pseudonocardia sp. DLS-67]
MNAQPVPGSRRAHPGPSVTVQVAGGTQQDRTALAAALLRAGSGGVTFTGGQPGGPLGAAVDAVVLLAPAAQVIGAAELDLAHTLRHRSPRILLALTGFDRHPGWREVVDADLDRLRAVGATVAPFAVSVDMHHRAVATGDLDLAAASGIPALARRLDDIAEQAAPRPARRPRTVPDRARWQQVLADGMAAASSDVDFDLRSRVRAAVADAEGVVEASDPTRDWTAIETWLRARLTYECEQTFALLADRTADVTAALDRELGGEPLPRPTPPDLPDPFGHLPARDAPQGFRRPLATRGRSILMSGYGGLMMALILPRFAGVHLPAWVIVTGALTTALLLGGATLSGERKRQLETTRTRTKTRVRQMTDTYVLVTTKTTRDTIRNTNQKLRTECTNRTMEP